MHAQIRNYKIRLIKNPNIFNSYRIFDPVLNIGTEIAFISGKVFTLAKYGFPPPSY